MNNLQVIEYKAQRVLTTAQLASGYNVPPIKVQQNFSNNKKRYIEYKHYYCLKGAELKAFKRDFENFEVAENINKLYLWTEHGALLHAKSLNTDKAWETYEYLIDSYFRAKEIFSVPQTLPEALRLAADLADQIEQQKPLVAFAETATQSNDSILMRELAKLCCNKYGIETGEKRLYRKLREWGLIMQYTTEPYQQYVDRGYFEVSEGTQNTPYGVKLQRITRVLPKGQIYIINRLRKEAI